MLSEQVARAARIIEKLGGEVWENVRSGPVPEQELEPLRKSFPRPLPASLVSLYCTDSSSAEFVWNCARFGADCKAGEMDLLSPKQAARTYESNRRVAAELLRAAENNEGARLIAVDWPKWLPLFRFANGDSFCLDMSSPEPEPPVVFLEHDAMDGGPAIHGLVIASSLASLLEWWGRLLFVDAFDWGSAKDASGRVSPESEFFRPLREAIAAAERAA